MPMQVMAASGPLFEFDGGCRNEVFPFCFGENFAAYAPLLLLRFFRCVSIFHLLFAKTPPFSP